MINRFGCLGNFGPNMNPKLNDDVDEDEEEGNDSDFLDDIDED